MKAWGPARAFLGVALSLFVVSTPAGALDIRVGAELFGTIGGYDMTDLNEATDALNDHFTANALPIAFDGVERGVALGGAIRADLWSRLRLAAHYERLFGAIDVGGPLDKNRITLAANLYGFSAGANLTPRQNFSFGLEGGIGVVSSAVVQTITDDDEEVLRDEFTGDDLTIQTAFFFEVPLSATLSVASSIGYRWAKIQDVAGSSEDTPDPVPDEESDAPLRPRLGEAGGSLDWSGVIGRVGITLWWG